MIQFSLRSSYCSGRDGSEIGRQCHSVVSTLIGVYREESIIQEEHLCSVFQMVGTRYPHSRLTM